jgi:hypothetical protein
LAFVCFVLAGLGFWVGSAYWPVWADVAAVFGSLTLLWPRLLSPFNRLWFWFGLALHKIVNPVVMGVLFFAVVTPIGVLMRLTSKRTLELEFEPNRSSYWIRRDSALQPGSMTKQY